MHFGSNIEHPELHGCCESHHLTPLRLNGLNPLKLVKGGGSLTNIEEKED